MAVDRDARALRTNEDRVRKRFPATDLTTLVADLTGPLALPELDGLVAANSLHYVRPERQVEVIRTLAGHLRPGGRFVVVEYDADRGNPYVPFPFSVASWRRLATRQGSSRRRRSAASRAGSSARSTRRSAAAPEGCLTTGVA